MVTVRTIAGMDANEARTFHMRRLVAQAGGPAEWARRFGGDRWQQPQVSQWISEQAPKGIGKRLARDLEQAQGLTNGFLDRIPDSTPPNGVAEPISTYDATPSHPLPNQRQKVRVEGMGAMDDQGFWKPGAAEHDLWVVNTDDPKAYAIRVLTQHFQSVVAPGQILLVSPSQELKLGRWVLVTLHDGRRTFRTFRGHEYGMWHFAAVNDQAAYLDLPDADVRSVERVMSVWWTD